MRLNKRNRLLGITSNYPKSKKTQTLIFAPFTVNFVYSAFSGTGISLMDHIIIKTELKFVFSMVELPKYTKNQNMFNMFFGPFLLFFVILQLRGPVSRVNIVQKSKFAKFEFSASDLPKKSKIATKKLFWPIFIFNIIFVIIDSLTNGFGLVTQPSNIGPGRLGYHWTEHMFVYILATERQIDFNVLKYQDSSKFKFVIFLAVFRP
jgi:hypothetical protein